MGRVRPAVRLAGASAFARSPISSPTRSFGKSFYPDSDEPLIDEKALDLVPIHSFSPARHCDGDGAKEPKLALPPLNLPHNIAQKQSGSFWVSDHAVLG